MYKWLVLLFVGSSVLMASDGAMLAKKCVGCHGVKFEKRPLGRWFHVVKGESKKEIIKNIKDYQHTTESDELVMKKQVKDLTDADIKALAEYISAIK